MSHSLDSAASRNRLLSSLSSAVLERLLEDSSLEDATQKQWLYKHDTPIQHVFFVVAGVASVISQFDGGKGIEVATVGNEGMVGLPAFLGADTASLDCFVQIPGTLLRMRSKDFRAHATREPELMQVMHRYTQALLTQIAQSSACNRVHAVQERCARWLLMTHDRVDSDEFPLTQEFLGQMLGVRRASVGATAASLQASGLIRYSRGVITVLDRSGLEETSCECYAIVEQEYDRLLNGSRPRRRARRKSS